MNQYLEKNAHKVDFLQLVRLLERMYPERRPVGEGVEPQKEVVRFKSRVRFDFPPGDVDRLEPGDPGQDIPPTVWVNFLGLAGQFGPLPQVFTELIRDRTSQYDYSPRDFLDIFNHRLLSLLVRIRKKFTPGLEVKHPADAAFSNYLYSFVGLGTPGLRNRQKVSDQHIIGLAGLMMRPCPTENGLIRLLSQYFGVEVALEQFKGKWIQLESDQWSRLSSRGGAVLGNGAVLGKRVWDQQGAFELLVGPLSKEQFVTFLPNGSAYPALCELVRYYIGPVMGFDIQLILEAKPIPGTRLSSTGDGDLLGWTTWLRADHVSEGPRVHLNPEQRMRQAAAV